VDDINLTVNKNEKHEGSELNVIMMRRKRREGVYKIVIITKVGGGE